MNEQRWSRVVMPGASRDELAILASQLHSGRLGLVLDFQLAFDRIQLTL